jgi:hypothetical protein
MRWIHDPRETPEGLLDKGFTRSEDIDELLWVGSAAHGPEPGTNSTSHDHTIIILGICHRGDFYISYKCTILLIQTKKEKNLENERFIGESNA